MIARCLPVVLLLLLLSSAPAQAAPEPQSPMFDQVLTGEATDARGRTEVYATFTATSAGPDVEAGVSGVRLRVLGEAADEGLETVFEAPMHAAEGSGGPTPRRCGCC